jgi:polyphenol oxidase
MGWTVSRWDRRCELEQRFGDRSERPPKPVVTLRQVHGRIVRHIDEVTSGSIEGDALVTDRAGSSVGVWTADCVPLHLVSSRSRVVAAVHCGWRGTAAGIVPAVLEALGERWGLRPSDLEAALGPSIGGCCYEVGSEVRDAFTSRTGDLGRSAFEMRRDRLHLDLRTFIAAELESLGIARVERVGPCTACRSDVLHSYRKDRGSGRQLSWIGICDEP